MLTRYVNTASSAGGDGTTTTTSGDHRAYASLNEFESSEQANLSDPIEAVCEGTAADNTVVYFDGWTTSSGNYISVKTTQANRHDGKWNTNKYRMETPADSYCMQVYEEYVRLDGLQFKLTTGIERYAIRYTSISGGEEHVSNCIIRGTVSGGSYCSGIVPVTSITNTPTLKIWNNIIYGFDGAWGCGMLTASVITLYVYNNTISDCTYGVRNHTGDAVIHTKNNAIFNTTDDFYGTMTTCDYNASDDGDGTNSVDISPGGTEADDWASAFVGYNSSPPDFHIKDTNSVLYNAGINDPGSGLFSDDIDNDTRSGSWDIGADEYVAIGGNIKSINNTAWANVKSINAIVQASVKSVNSVTA